MTASSVVPFAVGGVDREATIIAETVQRDRLGDNETVVQHDGASYVIYTPAYGRHAGRFVAQPILDMGGQCGRDHG